MIVYLTQVLIKIHNVELRMIHINYKYFLYVFLNYFNVFIFISQMICIHFTV